MQNIIIEKPYTFIPPRKSGFWPAVFQELRIVDRYLKKYEGVESYRIEGADHLRESLRLGKGVLLTPNHCRYADPFVMGWVARSIQKPVYAMASWHLFEQHWFHAWAIRAMGGFSIYREGVDRQSIDTAIDILASAARPLVLFPEGSVFRTNDQLQALLEGVAFIARTAAKRQVKSQSKGEADGKGVAIHPVAIKYLFHGDLEKSIIPVLDRIEKRLTWIRPEKMNLIDRVDRIIKGLLSLKEIEYMGSAQQGELYDRQQRLIDHVLFPLEDEWLGNRLTGAIIPRIKALRIKILPELLNNELDSRQRQHRWRHLSDLYLAQQIASYPSSYLTPPTTETRVLETVERLEEDLTDRVTIHRPFEAVVEIGEAIEVPTDRGPRGEEDPLMVTLKNQLQSMLSRLAAQSKVYCES